MASPRLPRVVVVGGGFGGLNVARTLASSAVEVTLIDRRNHHLFQPLLYEVATAALSPGQIATPLRRVFRGDKNVNVVLGEVTAVDLEARSVRTDDRSIEFDYLVLATGSTHHYFGRPQWERWAPGLKTVEDALEIRRRFLLGFERADQSVDADERDRWMTTVIVGGGPTGIELAGTMSEVARHVLKDEFRQLDTSALRIVLAEGSDRLLSAMPAGLSERARLDLEQLGVTVRLETIVTDIDARGVTLASGERIEAANVLWAAGVRGAPVAAGLAPFQRDDRRLSVEPDLSLTGHPNVFAIGDLAAVETDGEAVPGLAPAAIQMGTYVGELIRSELRGDGAARRPFRYRDKGTLATIGRGRAVAAVGGAEFGGAAAWLLWVFVHILFLVGFRNRLLVLLDWAFAYANFQRGSRLITGEVGAADGGPLDAQPPSSPPR